MERVVIAAGARTPIGKFNGALAKVDAVELGAHAVRAALARTDLKPDYVAVGNVLQAANGQNPGRRAALLGGVERTVPGITLNDVCLASMSAVALAASMLRSGEATTVLAGGLDSMTRAPHAVRMRPQVKMGDAAMVDVMVHDGLYCSIADEGMGGMSDAENARLGVTREAQDRFAEASHAKALAGRERLAEEIAPLAELERDEGVRETSYEALAALKPAFTPDGTITAGNASQVSDGAAAAVITTADRAPEFLAEVVGRAVVAGPDSTLHLRPAEASTKLLARFGLAPADIALWEINEAFAGVVLASADALELDLDTVNVNGGAVALGHPLAGSGLRLILTLAYELRRRGGGLGVATLCGGGGQGEAILLRT
ncbi:acetyl-CoA C-acyltransferase [Solirubrobacter sp. CPCC 204708]|uniref:Probable acetyl-CoA acetyltransferase n=1 Tax=Solirubrobacter deserti TaxID=2282478 RepID=A0ABT4RL85_9ACTN|nr:acetyl-CoA C-acyltransferase [Solirubrobacter deserti]MBE2318984.1 acetyl-CoA C-acyltransferase [Solirubrobacter deserti]MDA0139291.1 acetyl-CoA C-acyltransferase [Solirubrobacter deserti]